LLPHGLGKSRVGVGSDSWDITSLSERSAPPGPEPGLPVEENDHEQKNYQKNVRVGQAAIHPGKYDEKNTGI
jgi:hypothetical protein